MKRFLSFVLVTVMIMGIGVVSYDNGSGVIEPVFAVSAETADPLGHYSATADSLSGDEKLVLVNQNTVMSDKHMRLVCNVNDLGSGLIRLGHGKRVYASQYIEITADVLRVCTYYSTLTSTEYSHGLKIDGDIEVYIDVTSMGKATITLITSSGSYKNTCAWAAGRNGEIFCEVEDANITDVDCRWYCDDYDSDFWFYGDSYFGNYSARWTYYLMQDGYSEVLLEGYGGMGTPAALRSFKSALDHGAPKYAIWCMGMNNGDGTGNTPNASWLNATTEFLKLCEEYEITPILSTIPTTPKVNNARKNAWVRSSGYRYVDFEYAVVANYTTGEWYDTFLSSDNVHPAQSGAEQLYLQVIQNVPEILTTKSENCSHNLRYVSEKNASCRHNGCKAFWLCTLCGNTYTVEDKNIAASMDQLQIPAVDHNYENDICIDCEKRLFWNLTEGTTKLLANTVVDTVVINPGATLDLNGYTLTADLFVAMNGAKVTDGGEDCTGGGKLKIAKENLVLAEDNGGIISLWNGVDGYIFTKATFQQMAKPVDKTAAQYIFLPAFSNAQAAALLADGGLDNSVKLKVSLTWNGGQTQQFYTYSDALLAKVVASGGRLAFSLNITGIEGISDMSASAVVVSDSGAQAAASATSILVVNILDDLEYEKGVEELPVNK